MVLNSCCRFLIESTNEDEDEKKDEKEEEEQWSQKNWEDLLLKVKNLSCN